MAKMKKFKKKPVKKPAPKKNRRKPPRKPKPKPPGKPQKSAAAPLALAKSAMATVTTVNATCSIVKPDGSARPPGNVDFEVVVSGAAPETVAMVKAMVCLPADVPADPLIPHSLAVPLMKSMTDPTRWTGSLPTAGSGTNSALAWPIIVADRCRRDFTVTMGPPPAGSGAAAPAQPSSGAGIV